jgi:NADPH:quinone reductase-like Zn-dependent oxidoreductase
MLITRAELRPGETVLIHGIGGGVALAGLQIAKLVSARAIVTSSSDQKLEKASALGADATINYRAVADVAATVRELIGGRGVDVAFDSVGADTWPVDFAAVRRGGRIVQCGVTTGEEAVTNVQVLHWHHLTVLGSSGGSVEDFHSMLRAVSVAGLRPVLDGVFPLDRIRAAAERLEAGEQFGKIVLRVS